MPEWVGLLILAGAVIVTVWHRRKFGCDAECDSILKNHEEQAARSWRTGLIPPLDSVLMLRAKRRLD